MNDENKEYGETVSYREEVATLKLVDALARARGIQRTHILREATRFYLDAQKRRPDLTVKERKALEGLAQ